MPTGSSPRTTRRPAVAGLFYPDDPERLAAEVRSLLDRAEAPAAGAAPAAVVAPHAGYAYSGAVAARALRRLEPLRGAVPRVVLLGPSHRVPFPGVALPAAAAFATPLGDVEVDREAVDRLRQREGVGVHRDAHAGEHSLEVVLPFLQVLLGDLRLVPLLVGDAAPQAVGGLVEALWDEDAGDGSGPAVVVVSTDLSHYHPYETARELDERTARAVDALRWEDVGRDAACGRAPLRGLLWAARRRGLAAHRLALCNSGDTAGPKDRVVGYGAWEMVEA